MFSDPVKAQRFIRRYRDRVLRVIVILDGGDESGAWKGAMKTNYDAVVVGGLILLQD